MEAQRSKKFENKVDADVNFKHFQDWSERMIEKVFRDAEQGDEIELKISIDFGNAPKYKNEKQRQELIRKITQLEANYLPKALYEG
ncbi:hypothetical protein V3C99_005835 [Haemonchus contortus]|uniref:Type I site-specific deoxyribonuclease n=1 Tax=Haemonchus contortus TaxID=6289 RepID=A0A7I4XUV7_HAECO|nr:unnamed protein product [Haemonchus contortus]